MYCAYTIPGMTGSSLMYYYNGKAVREHSSIPPIVSSPSSAAAGWELGGETRGLEVEREREERGRGGVKVKSVVFFTHQLHSAARRRASEREQSVSFFWPRVGIYFWKRCLLFIRGVARVSARACRAGESDSSTWHWVDDDCVFTVCLCLCLRVCVRARVRACVSANVSPTPQLL